jgi:hypothetical protein
MPRSPCQQFVKLSSPLLVAASLNLPPSMVSALTNRTSFRFNESSIRKVKIIVTIIIILTMLISKHVHFFLQMMQTRANTYFNFVLLDAFTADRNNFFDGSDAWVVSKLKKSSIRTLYKY